VTSRLARLVDAGVLDVARQGPHRYFRLAGAEVAAESAPIRPAACVVPPPGSTLFGLDGNVNITRPGSCQPLSRADSLSSTGLGEHRVDELFTLPRADAKVSESSLQPWTQFPPFRLRLQMITRPPLRQAVDEAGPRVYFNFTRVRVGRYR
jgi:hypothetical protein